MTPATTLQKMIRRMPGIRRSTAPSAERLPTSWESMLRALATTLRAQEAALTLMRSPTEPGYRFTLSMATPDAPKAGVITPDAAVCEAPDGERIWLVERNDGSATPSRLCAVLSGADDLSVQVELSRSNALAAFGSEDVRALAELLPGLTVALRAVLNCAPSSLVTQTFRRLPYGVALITPDRCLLFQNPTMRVLLSANDGLSEDRGLLTLAARNDQETLMRTLRQIAAGEDLAPQLISLFRPSKRPPYVASLERFDPGFMPALRGQPVLRLAVADPEYSDAAAVARLALHFRLTPTETDVVQYVMQGMDVASCSQQLRLAVSTVRWHQKRVFAKTGTSGRASLILLFMRAAQLQGEVL